MSRSATAWRAAAAATSVLLVAVSFAPWWSLPAQLFDPEANNAWRTSTLWVVAVLLGVVAGLVALGPAAFGRRRFLLTAGLGAVGLLLVLLPHTPCPCGIPGSSAGPDYGWFAYAPLNAERVVERRSDWGRSAAAGLLAAQVAGGALAWRLGRRDRTDGTD